MNPAQRVLIGLGALCASYGGWLLLLRPHDLIPAGTWLAGGVVLHDAVLAPLVIVSCIVVARVLPQRWRATAAMILVTFGSLTVIAIPVLGRFGAKADNPTLLDRNYLLGWVVLGALTLAGSVLVTHFSPHRANQATEASEEQGEGV